MFKSRITKPIRRPAGRPTANRFRVGAARLMTPNAMFATSSAVAAGSANCTAPASIRPPQLATIQSPRARAARRPAAASKLSDTSRIVARWPPSERKISVPKIKKNWLITRHRHAALRIDIVARPRPMLIAIVWPAVISASKIICRQKPIAAPIRTSCATMSPRARELERRRRTARAARPATSPPARGEAHRASARGVRRTAGRHRGSAAIAKERPDEPPARASIRASQDVERDAWVCGCAGAQPIRRGNALERRCGVVRRAPSASSGPAKHQRGDEHEQLRDERQRHLVDLRRGLEHADQRGRRPARRAAAAPPAAA